MELALRAYAAAGADMVMLPHSHGHLVAMREEVRTVWAKFCVANFWCR